MAAAVVVVALGAVAVAAVALLMSTRLYTWNPLPSDGCMPARPGPPRQRWDAGLLAVATLAGMVALADATATTSASPLQSLS